jgi:hypothetical protein
MGLLLWRWLLRRLIRSGFVGFHLRQVFVAAVHQHVVDVLLWTPRRFRSVAAHFLIP